MTDHDVVHTESPETVPNRFLSKIQQHFNDRADDIFCRLIGRDGERELRWRDLQEHCSRFAASYHAAGLKHGDQILIFLRHVPELYGAFFGAMLSGMQPSFMPCTSPRQDPKLYWHSHTQLLERIQPAAIVADQATIVEIREAGLSLDNIRIIVLEELTTSAYVFFLPAESETALLQHSSGTTGLKKGVALSYDAITQQIESYAKTIALNDSDCIVSWLPLYHDMGLIACCILPAYFAVPITHIDPFLWVGKPDLLFVYAMRDQATFTWLPNFAYEHLVTSCGRKANQYQLAHMRAFINCSEPCKALSFDRFLQTFAIAGVNCSQLQCCYAMAETVFAVAQTPLGQPVTRISVDTHTLLRNMKPEQVSNEQDGVKLLAAGYPIPGIEYGIFDELHRPVTQGCIGEIGISGPMLFSGYNKDPQRSQQCIQSGIYFSRDLGFVDNGQLYVLGRLDDLIIINGRNLYAHEIEASISGTAGLKPGRSVALSQFDARSGSANLIVIVEKISGSLRTNAEIQQDILRTIHSVFNIMPAKLAIQEEGWLIKTTSGKIGRQQNLEKLLAETGSKEHS